MDNTNANSEAVAARRAALQQALRNGEPTVVTPSGGVVFQQEAEQSGEAGIQVPDGKLA